MKTMFSCISNRTVVANMFVGNPDTEARKAPSQPRARPPAARLPWACLAPDLVSEHVGNR